MRIEAVEGFVEDQHLRTVHQCLGDLDALAHALREPLDVALGDISEVDCRECVGGRALDVRNAAQPSARLDEPAGREPWPEPVTVRHEADRGTGLAALAWIKTNDADVTLVRAGQPSRQTDRRRLAGAVVAEQASNARLNGKGDIAHGDGVAEPLGDAVELEERRHASLRR